MIRPRLLLCCALLPLSGCLSSVLPKSESRAVYAMDEVPAATPCGGASHLGGLLVEAPRALPPLDGVDLIFRRPDGELQILPGARWAAPAPALLQDLLAQTLDNACLAQTVSQSSAAHALPLRLSSELRAMSIQRDSDLTIARLTVSLRLSCVRSAEVIASRAFTVDQQASPAPTAAAAGLRSAARQWALQVRDWLATLPATPCD